MHDSVGSSPSFFGRVGYTLLRTAVESEGGERRMETMVGGHPYNKKKNGFQLSEFRDGAKLSYSATLVTSTCAHFQLPVAYHCGEQKKTRNVNI